MKPAQAGTANGGRPPVRTGWSAGRFAFGRAAGPTRRHVRRWYLLRRGRRCGSSQVGGRNALQRTSVRGTGVWRTGRPGVQRGGVGHQPPGDADRQTQPLPQPHRRRRRPCPTATPRPSTSRTSVNFTADSCCSRAWTASSDAISSPSGSAHVAASAHGANRSPTDLSTRAGTHARRRTAVPGASPGPGTAGATHRCPDPRGRRRDVLARQRRRRTSQPARGVVSPRGAAGLGGWRGPCSPP